MIVLLNPYTLPFSFQSSLLQLKFPKSFNHISKEITIMLSPYSNSLVVNASWKVVPKMEEEKENSVVYSHHNDMRLLSLYICSLNPLLFSFRVYFFPATKGHWICGFFYRLRTFWRHHSYPLLFQSSLTHSYFKRLLHWRNISDLKI